MFPGGVAVEDMAHPAPAFVNAVEVIGQVHVGTAKQGK
ncbi:hypothetical protein Ga0080559_TMP770 [Salipiger profundus]|uniref:Uncharacterized protein n=1 Tax=Salipiger profundus TaxID=1229727 RepID=A0A1U7D0G4_9RHOB|nr:hypothetical protein Ga0080559_TMP770 [Salipiger profundus]